MWQWLKRFLFGFIANYYYACKESKEFGYWTGEIGYPADWDEVDEESDEEPKEVNVSDSPGGLKIYE